MRVLTKDLSGPALDWAVASCGLNGRKWENVHFGNFRVSCGKLYLNTVVTLPYSPSTDWAQGGPIIASIKGLVFKQWLESKPESCCEAHIHNYDGNWIAFGPTLLVAIMRCYIAYKLGDSVEIPDSLAS